MQTKGQNFYFWSGFRFQKWFNMSYEHMLKVRVLSNIDDLKKKFFVSMLKVSLQREGKPETENENPCTGDRKQDFYRLNSLLVMLNCFLTHTKKKSSLFCLWSLSWL